MALSHGNQAAKKSGPQDPVALDNQKERYTEFLGTLAHEIRNSFTPIYNSLHIIKFSCNPSPDVNESFAIIDRQMRGFLGLVDDIHDVSRFARGQVVLRMERASLAEIVDSAVEACRPLLEAAELQLEFEWPPDAVKINADLQRLPQAFIKLLQNAAKFSLPGGRVTVRCQLEDKQAVVRVIDTGIGIEAGMLDKVFDLFTQLNDPRALSRNGLGIGLSLVRDIVRIHGGTVEAHSKGAGLGSEFLVRLPLAGD
jgi:signal transduction histidine kinase